MMVQTSFEDALRGGTEQSDVRLHQSTSEKAKPLDLNELRDSVRLFLSDLCLDSSKSMPLRLKFLENLSRNIGHLSERNVTARFNQLRALGDIVKFLKELKPKEKIKGYIRQPTGAGKTFLFGFLTYLLDVNTVILVPTSELLRQTKEELIEKLGFKEEDIGIVGTIIDDEGKSVTLNQTGRKITLATYAMHVSRMHDPNDNLYKITMKAIELMLCDEAHQSLGAKTQMAIKDVIGEEELEEDEVIDEEEISAEKEFFDHEEDFVPREAACIGFTATPELRNKSVEDYFVKLISTISIAELVKARILKKYKVIQVEGELNEDEDKSKITREKELNILEREDIYRKLLKKYAEYKQAHPDLPLRPAVFCANTTECEKFQQMALEEFGYNSMIITNKIGNNDKKKAEEALLAGKIEFIITVDKLGTGWNFPPLNTAILARATGSPARIIQPTGRAARQYMDELFAYIFEAQWKIKSGYSDPDKEMSTEAKNSDNSEPSKASKAASKKALTLANALARIGEDPYGVIDELEGDYEPYVEYPEMDKEYFENPENVKADLEAYAKISNCTLTALHTGNMKLIAACNNGESILGYKYLRRAAVALGLAKTAEEATNMLAQILFILKKKAGINVVNYPEMDKEYFENPENVKTDLEAYAREASCSVGQLNPHKMVKHKALCSNVESVNGITYLTRAGVALGLAKDTGEAGLKRGEILVALKKLIGINIVEKPAMDKEYFENEENVKMDLEAYAKECKCSVANLNSSKIASSKVLCKNGETLLGSRYLIKAGVALGLAEKTKDAANIQAQILEKLKQIAKIEIVKTPPMDKEYFENIENVRADLEAYAKECKCKIEDLTKIKMADIRIVCRNGESIIGITYLTRAGGVLGISKDRKEGETKAEEILNALKKMLSIDVVKLLMDKDYFRNVAYVRADLEAYARDCKCSIADLTTFKIGSSNALCKNEENITGGTYLVRAGVLLGLAKDRESAALKYAEILKKLKETAGIEDIEDESYCENKQNIKFDLQAFANGCDCSIEALTVKKMRNVQVICSNGSNTNGFKYLNKIALALGLTKDKGQAPNLHGNILKILKAKIIK